jgi:hypothetical protein
MTKVVLDRGDVEVDASIIAEGLQLAAAQVQPLLRSGRISSRLERGVDEHEGQHRLTFVYGRRQLQVVVGPDGAILEQAVTERRAPRARPPRAVRK